MGDLTGAKVLLLMGSKSDWPVMRGCTERLRSLGVSHAVHVASAHRTPERVEALVREAEEAGVEVFIAAAGMAAHLAGAIAARTTKPVIGVPIAAESFLGFDSMLATVQMPPGVPVLTVAAGSAGAVNAAVAATQILAIGDDSLAARLAEERQRMAARVDEQDRELIDELNGGE
jgi:phosphoribosylaminoimidazole carboxylase PurE protein